MRIWLGLRRMRVRMDGVLGWMRICLDERWMMRAWLDQRWMRVWMKKFVGVPVLPLAG